MRIQTFHRRDAEYAEKISFAQSGDDDWAKTYSLNLSKVFVCRRLPTNKKLILCALCGSTLLTTLSPIEGRLCGKDSLRPWRPSGRNLIKEKIWVALLTADC